MGGLLRYLYGPGERNEHVEQHLIASWDDFPERHEPPVRENGKHDVRQLAKLLTAPAALGEALDKPVYHLVLSTKGGEDRHLSDAEFAEVARDALDRTGLARRDDPGGCRWVAVRHGLSADGNEHVHVVVELARQDGQPVRLWQDFRQVRKVCEDAEVRLGLRETGRQVEPKRREREQAVQRGLPEPDRDRLRREVRLAASASSDPAEFLERLRSSGVMVKERRSERDGALTGYAVAVPGAEHRAAGDNRAVFFSGGKLAGDLSLPALQRRWNGSDGRTAANAGRVVSPDLGMTPRAAAEAVRQASGAPITSQVAVEALDTMLAAARVAEGRRVGPLTRSADRFARSTRGDRGSGTALAFVAGQLLRSPGKDDGGLADLVAALAALAVAVASWHEANRRAGQAREARQVGEQLREWRPAPDAAQRRPADLGERPAHLRQTPPEQGHSRRRA